MQLDAVTVNISSLISFSGLFIEAAISLLTCLLLLSAKIFQWSSSSPSIRQSAIRVCLLSSSSPQQTSQLGLNGKLTYWGGNKGRTCNLPRRQPGSVMILWHGNGKHHHRLRNWHVLLRSSNLQAANFTFEYKGTRNEPPIISDASLQAFALSAATSRTRCHVTCDAMSSQWQEHGHSEHGRVYRCDTTTSKYTSVRS